jgi:hypothetical protein
MKTHRRLGEREIFSPPLPVFCSSYVRKSACRSVLPFTRSGMLSITNTCRNNLYSECSGLIVGSFLHSLYCDHICMSISCFFFCLMGAHIWNGFLHPCGHWPERFEDFRAVGIIKILVFWDVMATRLCHVTSQKNVSVPNPNLA